MQSDKTQMEHRGRVGHTVLAVSKVLVWTIQTRFEFDFTVNLLMRDNAQHSQPSVHKIMQHSVDRVWPCYVDD